MERGEEGISGVGFREKVSRDLRREWFEDDEGEGMDEEESVRFGRDCRGEEGELNLALN